MDFPMYCSSTSMALKRVQVYAFSSGLVSNAVSSFKHTANFQNPYHAEPPNTRLMQAIRAEHLKSSTIKTLIMCLSLFSLFSPGSYAFRRRFLKLWSP